MNWIKENWFKFVALFAITLLAASCNQKQTIKNEPKAIVKNEVVASSTEPMALSASTTPTTTPTQSKPVSKPKPVKVNIEIPVVAPTPITPITIDVCKNIEGAQTITPAGMVADGQGNCIVPTPVPAPSPTLVTPSPAVIYVPTPQPVVTPTPTPDPAQMYKDCANARQQAYNELITAGASGNATQMNGLTNNQMIKDGYGYCLYLK